MVKSKKIEKKWCSPHKENNGYTCYSLDDLQKIAKSYNKTSHQKIKVSGKSRKQLWDGIRQALSNKCNNEICWAKQDFMNDRSIIKETFRPKMPQKWKEENLTTWLNTDDINRVMKQYEKKYPDFFFVGPIPLDCGINSDLQCQLTNFDIKIVPVEYADEAIRLGLTKELKLIEWTEVEGLSKSEKEDKTQASIQ